MAVLDWRRDVLGESGPPCFPRLWPQQVTDYLHAAGFRSVAQTWQDDDIYLMEGKSF